MKLEKYAVCASPSAALQLRREWPGTTVMADPKHRILPGFSYLVTPQLFLVEGGKVADAAIGALDCDAKLEVWSR